MPSASYTVKVVRTDSPVADEVFAGMRVEAVNVVSGAAFQGIVSRPADLDVVVDIDALDQLEPQPDSLDPSAQRDRRRSNSGRNPRYASRVGGW